MAQCKKTQLFSIVLLKKTAVYFELRQFKHKFHNIWLSDLWTELNWKVSVRPCASSGILKDMNKINGYLTNTQHNKTWTVWYRDDSRLTPSQWETLLQSNSFSHWLGTNLESAVWYNSWDVLQWMTSTTELFPPNMCPDTPLLWQSYLQKSTTSCL